MKITDYIKRFFIWLWQENQNPRLSFEECQIIPLQGKYFEEGYCLGDYSYENSSRTKLGKLIYNFKYKGDKKAGEILSNLLTELIKSRFTDIEILVTVPPTVVSRVHQPTHFLAGKVSEQTNLSWVPALLFRTKLTGRQKEVRSKYWKARNVANLYQLKEEYEVRDKRILVVDDIYDSGETLNEISRVLKSKGAYYIGVVTLARTGFDQHGLP